jgi:hypothetical protein
VKVGGWLYKKPYKKPRKDCAEKRGSRPELVLDVSTLLELKGRKDVGYYCNSCSAGHRMGDTAIGTVAVEAIGPAVVVDLVIVEIIFE